MKHAIRSLSTKCTAEAKHMEAKKSFVSCRCVGVGGIKLQVRHFLGGSLPDMTKTHTRVTHGFRRLAS